MSTHIPQQILDNEHRTQQTYNLIAEQWAREHATKEYWRREFTLFSELLPSGKILDIGCGAGRDYQLFAEGAYDYIGVDYSEGMLTIARSQYPQVKFVFGNILDLPFDNHKFDGFWAAASLLHIPKNEMFFALENIRRVVKPQGIGAIMLKKGTGEMVVVDDNHVGNTDDQRLFSYWQKDEFAEVLRQSGFHVALFTERSVSERTTWLSFFVKV